MEVAVPDDAIDRIHRIGKKEKNAAGILEQPFIIKFTSWKHSTFRCIQRQEKAGKS